MSEPNVTAPAPFWVRPVPAEALIASMKEHQKYFHVVDTSGKLMPNFITVANIASKDPSQIIGRLTKPMIVANEEEREGYVPNVVYTCGMLQHGKLLIIPYAVSDFATVFASVEIDEILNEMKNIAE